MRQPACDGRNWWRIVYRGARELTAMSRTKQARYSALVLCLCVMAPASWREPPPQLPTGGRAPVEIRLCTVNPNVQTAYHFGIPWSGYAPVAGAISDIGLAHVQHLRSYRVPFVQFWRLTGLEQLFGPVPDVCCPSCPGVCAPIPDVVLVKPIKDPTDSPNAAFDWMDGPGTAQPRRQLNASSVGYSATLKLPQHLSGTVTIAPNAVHVFFDDNRPTLHLQVIKPPSGPLQSIFDDGVSCVGTSFNNAVIKPSTVSNSAPHLALVLIPH
jgi:hypothetical protein